ncbi:Succinyl-CoA--D-citramalate CoA-transferase [Hyphomicrobiales bacterium]|nr:Succinyl-CoA--D-citramalate CoA-transferase [Hyphomicrobiales bacterium]CAH1697552.1 Succinyl-CoA--D-citramalate CoA-transferase [Hyphomicrobiales bacterium]CAI0346307.1 Succinyl-CoA--D-citramalate CoA-transferase [Hyphomicrobiales bacterium]
MQKADYAPDARCPLDGVRVIDMSHLVAGNMLTQVLADLGADVIKIEPPQGDTLRAWKENGVAVQWKVYGRNKRSIAIDLKHAGGRRIFEALVRSGAILVENFRPGTLEKLGYGPDVLLGLNPALVITRLSGWGQTGPYRDRPGFGTLVEAFSGFAHKNGFPDKPPALPNLGLADSVAGLYGAAATLTALRHVEVAGGSGQVVDVSLLEPIYSILGADAAVHRASGRIPSRHGNSTPLSSPRNLYRSRDDKYLAISGSTQAMTERLLHAIGRPELIADPRFRTNADRVAHAEALDREIQAFIGLRTLDENLAYFGAAGVTAGPVHDGVTVTTDPHMIERGSVLEFPDDELSGLPMHAVVPRLSQTPGAIRRPAPALDEHAAEILRELGFEQDPRQ